MSTIDYSKPVHLIVHGQRDLIDSLKHKLVSLGFSEEKLLPASLEKTGNIGEYVAMAWPPMRATEVIINEITGIKKSETKENPMGAWANIEKKEILKNSVILNKSNSQRLLYLTIFFYHFILIY
jgi:hypothetical protein